MKLDEAVYTNESPSIHRSLAGGAMGREAQVDRQF
jgi:hypothetical protein